MLNTIANLRLVAKCCRGGERLEGELARWLSRSLESFLAHRSPSLNDAFGLRMPKGGIPWWREETIRQRDAALRQLAAMHLGHLSVAAQAREIGRLARRYASGNWRFDREREPMPSEYEGRQQKWIWIAFKTGAAMPLGERQLRQILGR